MAYIAEMSGDIALIERLSKKRSTHYRQ